MAIAYDAHSNVGADTTGGMSWTHTPVDTPRGVWVYVLQYLTFGDEVTGVTYGGVGMTETAISPMLWDAEEDYAVYSYFLGAGVPTGAQTVVVSVDATGSVKRAGAITVTAAADTAVQNTLQTESNGTSTGTLALTGTSCFVANAIMGGTNVGGLAAPAGWTQLHLRDFGTEAGAAEKYDTVGTADVTIGPWSTGANCISVAIKESAASTTPTLSIPLATSITATSAVPQVTLTF